VGGVAKGSSETVGSFCVWKDRITKTIM